MQRAASVPRKIGFEYCRARVNIAVFDTVSHTLCNNRDIENKRTEIERTGPRIRRVLLLMEKIFESR